MPVNLAFFVPQAMRNGVTKLTLWLRSRSSASVVGFIEEMANKYTSGYLCFRRKTQRLKLFQRVFRGLVMSAILSRNSCVLHHSRLAKLKGTYCTEFGVLSLALLDEI
jgi:hypothetical protein